MATFPVLRGDGSDTLVLSQLGARSSAGGPYLSALAAATFAAPTFDGSGPLELGATLQPLPQHALQVDLRGADFASHAAGVHPQAALIDTRFLVHSAPYGLGYAWVGPVSPLLTLIQRAGQEGNRALALQYGDPFPATWGRVGVALSFYAVPFTLASGKTGLAAGYISHEDELSRLVRGPVAPEVRHASALRVDGADAASARTLASPTPTVSWEAPVAGAAPSAYTLEVVQVSDPGGAASVVRSVRADMLLPASARSVRLPEGILAPGGEYYLSLTAWRAPSWDFTRHPFTYGFPNSTATRVSGLLSVPATP